ncbi:3-dehydroquinate synthase [Asaia sp. W19]|uniref:3-dehydroquinate synthase n=1 Tax=unclassified Asaia TaxID=2685023 RepID=UPI000F8D3B84|nr:3-dehydroquinate synthase [Asaia sp. W19]RUT26819.1 3-dehydroquinate synthase [Asaia sp. W19]
MPDLPDPAPGSVPSPIGSPPGIIVLVGLMGAGKTTIGRRLAARLGLDFIDADHEIERAAGCTIAEIFARHGEPAFRDGERRVIQRLLQGGPKVLATGGGAFIDAQTRKLVKTHARSIWLRCPLPILVRRVSGRTGRPLLDKGNVETTLATLQAQRHPIYAEADIIVDCGDDSVDHGAQRIVEALDSYAHPLKVPVTLESHHYEVLIGSDLIGRAGSYLAPILPQKRVVIVTDETVAALHLPRLLFSLAETGFDAEPFVVPVGEESKSLTRYAALINDILDHGMERGTAIIGLGGGVVGDLSGFVAASVLRGVPFVQIPTTLLSQVDSSVGGKTGLNARAGKNLVGAFYQPQIVLADSSALATLTRRERVAGYAEIVKAGLIADPALFAWCEAHGADILDGDPAALAEAVHRACQFKARVVMEDEKETAAQDGRALLNLGHSFGHALEAHFRYDGRLLHGEAVSIGLHLAASLSVRLGYCPEHDLQRLDRHLRGLSMPAGLDWLDETLSASELIRSMARDKKVQDGRLSFVLMHGIGRAFTTRDVEMDTVRDVLVEAGCSA